LNSNDNKLNIQLDKRLRERFFGIYDNTSDENYNIIWKNDQENLIKNLNDQIESVESVRQRTTDLIKELEEKYENKIIFLVSHGDSLQILQTAFERISNANQQRYLKHLERAEFRPLILK
jgi:probable phosphoglycerate mutase